MTKAALADAGYVCATPDVLVTFLPFTTAVITGTPLANTSLSCSKRT